MQGMGGQGQYGNRARGGYQGPRDQGPRQGGKFNNRGGAGGNNYARRQNFSREG